MKKHAEAITNYRIASPSKEVGTNQLDLEIHLRSVELDYLRDKLDKSRKLFKKGLISSETLNISHVDYLSAVSALPAKMADIQSMDHSVRDVKRQIDEVLTELEQDSLTITRRFLAATVRFQRATDAVDRRLDFKADLIVAPERGMITEVMINSVGQIVTRGQPLATLAPSSSPLVAEVLIPDREAGRVKSGQVVRLKYDAFPYSEFGIKRGVLRRISPGTSVDPEIGAIYRGVIDLEETAVEFHGEIRPLKYGMRGLAEVVIDRQSLLGMVLRPLRGWRETMAFSSAGE